MAKWPQVITEDMWPFAICHMVNFHNASTLRNKNASPYSLFTGQEAPWSLNDFRVFGCPAYILAKRLQDGDNYSKWKARSWQGVYIGNSACHAGNIPLIYIHATTHVTPQYHVVYDEGFTSITDTSDNIKDDILQRLYDRAQWTHKLEFATDDELYYFDSFWMDLPLAPCPEGHGRKRVRFDDNLQSKSSSIPNHSEANPPVGHIHEQVSPANLPVLNPVPGAPQMVPESNAQQAPRHTAQEAANIAPGSAYASEEAHHYTALGQALTAEEASPYIAPGMLSNSEGAPTTTATVLNSAQNNATIPGQVTSLSEGASTQTTLQNPPHVANCPQYKIFHGSLDFQHTKIQCGLDGNIYILAAHTYPDKPIPLISDSNPQHGANIFTLFHDIPYTPSEPTIASYLAMNNKEDTLTQSQMLRTTNVDSFLKAQIPEIRGLENMSVFDYKPISSLLSTAKLLSSIWSYRGKRRPNGELLKYKARLCVDGSQQLLGRDYWETYAPVVSWSTVCLILLLSTILNLKCRQVDYTQAFPQTELNDPVFMRLPQGWYIAPDGSLQLHENPKHNDLTHYIQLKRNLYGCKQAARNWFQHLNQGILALHPIQG
jgi:hypothetical protein